MGGGRGGSISVFSLNHKNRLLPVRWDGGYGRGEMLVRGRERVDGERMGRETRGRGASTRKCRAFFTMVYVKYDNIMQDSRGTKTVPWGTAFSRRMHWISPDLRRLNGISGAKFTFYVPTLLVIPILCTCHFQSFR